MRSPCIAFFGLGPADIALEGPPNTGDAGTAAAGPGWWGIDLYAGDLGHGGQLTGWTGQRGAPQGSRLGLLLDTAEGSLSVFLDGAWLGVANSQRWRGELTVMGRLHAGGMGAVGEPSQRPRGPSQQSQRGGGGGGGGGWVWVVSLLHHGDRVRLSVASPPPATILAAAAAARKHPHHPAHPPLPTPATTVTAPSPLGGGGGDGGDGGWPTAAAVERTPTLEQFSSLGSLGSVWSAAATDGHDGLSVSSRAAATAKGSSRQSTNIIEAPWLVSGGHGASLKVTARAAAAGLRGTPETWCSRSDGDTQQSAMRLPGLQAQARSLGASRSQDDGALNDRADADADAAAAAATAATAQEEPVTAAVPALAAAAAAAAAAARRHTSPAQPAASTHHEGGASHRPKDPTSREPLCVVLPPRRVTIPDPAAVQRCARLPELGPQVLFFSGGSALRAISQALKRYTHHSVHLITPFDSGGSSATIRDAFDMLAVGDLRNRLTALADDGAYGNPDFLALASYRLPESADSAQLSAELTAMVSRAWSSLMPSILTEVYYLCPACSCQASIIMLRMETPRQVSGHHPLVVALPPAIRQIVRSHLHWFVKEAARLPATRPFDLSGASIGNLWAGRFRHMHTPF
jgi:hypothetical protein